MIAQLFQPPGHILVCLVLADVVDQQGSHCAAVVSGGNGTISLLSRSIPDLGFDSLRIDLDRTGSELDADSRFGVELNSLRVKRLSRLDLPTPESPMRTTAGISEGARGVVEEPSTLEKKLFIVC